MNFWFFTSENTILISPFLNSQIVEYWITQFSSFPRFMQVLAQGGYGNVCIMRPSVGYPSNHAITEILLRFHSFTHLEENGYFHAKVHTAFTHFHEFTQKFWVFHTSRIHPFFFVFTHSRRKKCPITQNYGGLYNSKIWYFKTPQVSMQIISP